MVVCWVILVHQLMKRCLVVGCESYLVVGMVTGSNSPCGSGTESIPGR